MVCCPADVVRYLNCPCYVSSTDSILKCDFPHLAEHLVVSSCLQNHHSTFGYNSATLLSMFYFWHKALLKLKNEGIDIGKMSLILMELLENAICSLDSIIIQFHSKVENCFLTTIRKATLRAQSHTSVAFRSYSRHLTNANAETTTLSFQNLPEFNRLVSSLGHCGNNFTADLLTKAWSVQINDRRRRTRATHPHNHEMWRFDISRITTITVNSVPTNSKVVCGILLRTTHKNVKILASSHEQNIRTLLINGNIAPTFLHKGVNVRENISNMAQPSAAAPPQSNSDSWISEIVDVLKKIDVAMILVSGKIDGDVRARLNLHSICTLCDISSEVLNAVADSTGASVASYVTDCDQLNVATGISASIEDTYNINGHERASSATVSYITLCLPSLFLTIVLCHPVSEYLSCLEHTFWHAARRLSNATESNKVLPGGCVTEENVSSFLLRGDYGHNAAFLLSTKVLADGFRDFVNVVKSKSYEEEEERPSDFGVFDDYVGKIESWRSALRLACIVSQTDSIIITGDVVENIHERIVRI